MTDRYANYRRQLSVDETDFEWLHLAMMCYNSTWWKGQAPETVQLQPFDWRRIGYDRDSDQAILTTTFKHGTPWGFVRDTRTGEVTKFQIYGLADFNEFDFGTLWLPEHARN